MTHRGRGIGYTSISRGSISEVKIRTLCDDLNGLIALEGFECEESAVPVVKRDLAGGVEEGSLEGSEGLCADEGRNVGGHWGR